MLWCVVSGHEAFIMIYCIILSFRNGAVPVLRAPARETIDHNKEQTGVTAFMFNFTAEKTSDGSSLFTFCDVIMKCKLTWSTDYGFQRGSFFILGIFVCEWNNLNGFAEARDVSETIIRCTFYIQTAWKAVSRALWWTWWDGVDLRKWMAHAFGS